MNGLISQFAGDESRVQKATISSVYKATGSLIDGSEKEKTEIKHFPKTSAFKPKVQETQNIKIDDNSKTSEKPTFFKNIEIITDSCIQSNPKTSSQDIKVPSIINETKSSLMNVNSGNVFQKMSSEKRNIIFPSKGRLSVSPNVKNFMEMANYYNRNAFKPKNIGKFDKNFLNDNYLTTLSLKNQKKELIDASTREIKENIDKKLSSSKKENKSKFINKLIKNQEMLIVDSKDAFQNTADDIFKITYPNKHFQVSGYGKNMINTTTSMNNLHKNRMMMNNTNDQMRSTGKKMKGQISEKLFRNTMSSYKHGMHNDNYSESQISSEKQDLKNMLDNYIASEIIKDTEEDNLPTEQDDPMAETDRIIIPNHSYLTEIINKRKRLVKDNYSQRVNTQGSQKLKLTNEKQKNDSLFQLSLDKVRYSSIENQYANTTGRASKFPSLGHTKNEHDFNKSKFEKNNLNKNSNTNSHNENPRNSQKSYNHLNNTCNDNLGKTYNNLDYQSDCDPEVQNRRQLKETSQTFLKAKEDIRNIQGYNSERLERFKKIKIKQNCNKYNFSECKTVYRGKLGQPNLANFDDDDKFTHNSGKFRNRANNVYNSITLDKIMKNCGAVVNNHNSKHVLSRISKYICRDKIEYDANIKMKLAFLNDFEKETVRKHLTFVKDNYNRQEVRSVEPQAESNNQSEENKEILINENSPENFDYSQSGIDLGDHISKSIRDINQGNSINYFSNNPTEINNIKGQTSLTEPNTHQQNYIKKQDLKRKSRNENLYKN